VFALAPVSPLRTATLSTLSRSAATCRTAFVNQLASCAMRFECQAIYIEYAIKHGSNLLFMTQLVTSLEVSKAARFP